jgi:hypothetical protein
MGLVVDWASRFVQNLGVDRSGAGQEFPVLANLTHNHRASHWNEIAKAMIRMQEIAIGGGGNALPPLVRTSATVITPTATAGIPSPVLRHDDGSFHTFAGGTNTFDPSVATGLGGLDTGSEAASTWYYLYHALVSGSLGVIGSTALPATGPTGATSYRYLGAVFNDSGSDLRDFIQIGDQFMYRGPNHYNVFSDSNVAPDGADVNISLTDFIPATALAVSVLLKIDCASGQIVQLFVGGDAADSLHAQCRADGSAGLSSASQVMTVPLGATLQQVKKQLERPGGAGNVPTAEMFCAGWVDGFLRNT